MAVCALIALVLGILIHVMVVAGQGVGFEIRN